MGMCRISTQKIMGRLLIGENSLIREACLKITEACPCDCGFCDSKYKNIKVNKFLLNKCEWRKISNDLIASGIKNVVLSGGEPLLRPDITFDLIDLFRANNVYVVLNTSGVLLDKISLLDDLIYAHPNLIVFSIDHADPVLHDKSRNCDGLFSKIEKSISYVLEKSDISIGIRTVLTRYNYLELPTIIKKFAGIGVTCFKIIQIENDREKEYVLSYDDLKKFCYEIKTDVYKIIKMLSFEEPSKLDACKKIEGLFMHGADWTEIEQDIFSPCFKDSYRCCLGSTFITVQANGDVLPCCESEHYYYPILGNLKVMKVEEILSSTRFYNFLMNRLDYCIYCTQMYNIQLTFSRDTKSVEQRYE